MPHATTRHATPLRTLKDLTRMIQQATGFPEVLAALKNGRSATIDGAWGSAAPLTAAALGLHAPEVLLVVLAHVGDLDDFADDLATFTGIRPEMLPALEELRVSRGSLNATDDDPALAPSPVLDEFASQRIRVLKRLAREMPPRIVLTPMQSLLQPVPRLEVLRNASRTLKVSDLVSVEELATWLVAQGLRRVEVVEVAGEFSLRGGIL